MSETVSNAFLRLHNTYGMPWSEIAEKTGIPSGTVWDIAKGSPVPEKWKKQLCPTYKDLFSMPEAELRWAIENRQPFTYKEP